MACIGAITMKISTAKCKKRLATLWLLSSLLLFFLLILQTIFGHYEDNISEAWGWLLPTVMPTLSLIISVLVMDALGKGVTIKTVDRFLYRISFALSSVYLLLVALAILLQPFTPLSPLRLMNQSNLWLGPLQGLVAASMGVIFVKKEQE
jgi:hypothetical protein